MTISVSKFLSSAFAACVVLALSAAPAPAASSSGGQTYVDNFCIDRGVFQVCRDGRAQYNVVQTPSGNTLYEINAKYVYTTTEYWPSGGPEVVRVSAVVGIPIGVGERQCRCG